MFEHGFIKSIWVLDHSLLILHASSNPEAF